MWTEEDKDRGRQNYKKKQEQRDTSKDEDKSRGRLQDRRRQGFRKTKIEGIQG